MKMRWFKSFLTVVAISFTPLFVTGCADNGDEGTIEEKTTEEIGDEVDDAADEVGDEMDDAN
jgi:hypothetical protein